MPLYLDSASLADARIAATLGWVSGVTTNPSLMSRAGLPPAEVLAGLSELNFGQVFYQLTAKTPEAMLSEAHAAHALVEDGLVLKIPPTRTGFEFVSANHGMRTCITAAYSPAQALVARECRADYVVVYVNRAARLLGDGLGLVRDCARILAGSETQLIAASLKSPEEVWQSAAAGAQHLTMPLDVLLALMDHPLSAAAVEEFDGTGRGLEV